MLWGQQESFSVPFKKCQLTDRGQWGRLFTLFCFIGVINTDFLQVQQEGIRTHQAGPDHLSMWLNGKVWILKELDNGAPYHHIGLKLLVQLASTSEEQTQQGKAAEGLVPFGNQSSASNSGWVPRSQIPYFKSDGESGTTCVNWYQLLVLTMMNEMTG